MKKPAHLGCIIPILILVALVIWIRWSDSQYEKHRHENAALQQYIDSLPDADKRILMLNKLLENRGLHRNEERLIRSRIIFEYENLNLFDSAMMALDSYEDTYDKNVFTEYHRAGILVKKGDTIAAKNIFKEIVCDKGEYKPMNFINRLLQQWLNNGHSAEYSRYYDYLYHHICQLYALASYIRLNHDFEESLELACLYFGDSDYVNEVIANYLSFDKEHPNETDKYDVEKINIKMNHLYLGDYRRLSPYRLDIASILLSNRIDMANRLIIDSDSINGLSETAQILNDNFKSMPTLNFCDLLFMKAYKKYAGINDNFPTATTYTQYKEFPKNSTKLLTFATPMTSVDTPSALINKGVTEGFIVLKCNDWSISDSTLFTPETIASYTGKPKKIVYLKKDYTVDSVVISEDKIGALLNVVFVPEPVYRMLLYDFINN